MQSTEFVLMANDRRSLIRHLRNLGQRVGPRTGVYKRSKSDKELFCLRRYLATLAANRRCGYPIAVEMGESPDFIISSRGERTGLEVTEATTQDFQKFLTRFERERDLEASLDDGLIGDIPEREWVDAVISAIDAKVEKIKIYRPARKHDILIYSNHPRDFVRGFNGRHPEYQWLAQRTKECATRWRSAEPRFGIVSIIDGQTVLYDLAGECIEWKMVDLRR